jgi:tetratricopeptide (TPR) repeat protein
MRNHIPNAKPCFVLTASLVFLCGLLLPTYAQTNPTNERKYAEPQKVSGDLRDTEYIREQSRKHDEAEKLCQEAHVLYRAGKTSVALEKYRRVIELVPEHYAACEKIAEYYMERKEWREAEKAFRLFIKPDTENYRRDYYATTLAKYTLVELRLGNRLEAFRAYHLARTKLSGYTNYYPVFDDLMQVKELEAAVRLILLDTISYTKNDERIAEVEKILELAPKFAYAHYELADKLLRGRFESDRAAYRKAATPHYEAAIKYGTNDLQKRAHKALQQFQYEEANSKQ